MAGPWERYGAPAQTAPAAVVAGPWAKYGQPQGVAALPEPEQQQQPQAPQVSAGRTALDQGLQGATFGFADEVTDRLGAAIAAPFLDETYGQLLAEARNNSKMRMQQEFEQRPGLAIGSNLAGGILTGVAGASTKAGAAIGNSIRSGGTAARIAKGALAGAASGGLYGAGSADEGERLEGAETGALLGGFVGGAVPAIGAAASKLKSGASTALKGATARGADQLDEAASAIKTSSSELYRKARDAGVVFKPDATSRVVSQVEKAVSEDGILNPRLHDKTLGLLDDFKEAAKAEDFGLEQLDQWRQLFGEVAGNFGDKVNARKAKLAIRTIDDTVDNIRASDIAKGDKAAIDSLRAARGEWQKLRKFESVADVVKQADGDPNRLKAGLQRFVNNPKKLRGFTKEEVEALTSAAKNTPSEMILKGLGKFGIDFGSPLTPGNSFLPFVTGTLGSPGLVAGGTAARQTQKYLARGKADDVLRLIEGQGASALKEGGAPITGGIIPGVLSGRAGTAALPAAEATPQRIAPEVVTPVAPLSETEPEVIQPNDVQSTIRAAADSHGIPAPVMLAFADIESSFNPEAKAKTSSAEGLFQFTKPTWAGIVRKYGQEYGLTMDDRSNPEKNSIGGALLTRDNAVSLGNRLGRAPTPGEVYMAHFLGDGKAARLISLADSDKPAVRAFPREAEANRSIFFDGKRPRTLAEVYSLLDNKVNAKIQQYDINQSI